jgi:hypothetical protein
MSARFRSSSSARLIFCGFGAALAWAAVACSGSGGGSSPNAPSNPGTSGPSCRTAATSTRAVQTFVTGVVVTTDSVCAFNSGTTQVNCDLTFTDTSLGPGTGSQTTRFASLGDLVDEASTNPPRALSLGTTTVLTPTGLGFSLTTTATNTFDVQKRLTSTTTVTPAGPTTITTVTTFTAWDASGRPTAGSSTPSGGFTATYDNVNRTVTRVIGPNTCTVTHDTNGIIIREQCTGTTGSTTDVLIRGTQQICK